MTNISKCVMTWGNDLPILPKYEQDKRRLEMSQILTALKRIPMGKEGNRYYPIRFLREGIDAYLGLFANGAIYYSSLAVELALIVRLGERGILREWREREKNQIKEGTRKREHNYLSFSDLIKWAKQKSLLDNKATKLAHEVRKMRNSYIHYYNIMWHQIDIDRRTRNELTEMLPKLKEEIERYARPGEYDKLVVIVDSMADEVLKDVTLDKRGIPMEDIRPNKEAISFIEQRLDSFVKPLSGLQIKEERDKASRDYLYGIEWRDALDCLRWSAYILAHLEFLKGLD